MSGINLKADITDGKFRRPEKADIRRPLSAQKPAFYVRSPYDRE